MRRRCYLPHVAHGVVGFGVFGFFVRLEQASPVAAAMMRLQVSWCVYSDMCSWWQVLVASIKKHGDHTLLLEEMKEHDTMFKV